MIPEAYKMHLIKLTNIDTFVAIKSLTAEI